MLVLVVSPSSGVYRTHFGFWQVPSSRRYCRQRKHRFLHFSMVSLLSLRIVVGVELFELRFERRLRICVVGHYGSDVGHQDLIFCPLVASIELIERPIFLFFIAQRLLGLAAQLADLFFKRVDAIACGLALRDEVVCAVRIRLCIDAGFVDSRDFVVGDF